MTIAFSPWGIFVSILFGMVGLAAFVYGRKQGETRPLLIGIALMSYSYFIESAWISFVVGAILTVLIFYPE